MQLETQKCHICGRESEFYSEYLKQPLCKKHLERMLTKRIRSALISKDYKQRKFKLSPDGSDAYKMEKFVFRVDKKSGVLLTNLTMEDFALSVLDYFLTGKKPKQKIGAKTFFNPLYTTSNEEITAFLESKGEKTKPKKLTKRQRYLTDFMKDIEKRRPGGMLSIVKMGEKIGII